MEIRSQPPAEAVVVMDRFVSASSAQDATTSLEQIVGAFKNSNKPGTNRKEDEIIWEPAWIFEHEEIAEHLVWLLRHGTLKANDIPCEEGVHLICQLYQQLTKSSEALTKPSPGVLLESLLDILDNSEHPVYVRVLALRVLEGLSKGHKSIAVNQWLQAPNGLHRIADLFAIDIEKNPAEEAIRNQALIVAKSLAREAPMAKVFMFAEVDCKLLDLCWKEGGLTKGSPIVIDALELIQEVLKHADTSLQDLVWQRPNVAPRLVQLLDLRGGEEFLHPTQKSTLPANYNEVDDDLDSILASGDEKSREEGQGENASIPRLLPSEEKVVKLVLNILRLLLETDSVREIVWRQQAGLSSIMWELALVSNPSDPPVCALPSPSLQQEALNLVADKFNDPVIMDRLLGLDRLLYLVCTGGGISDTFSDKLGISQSALAVLRQSLSGDRIHDILMRTLAPPPTEDENTQPIGPTVVQKLWNTVQENLSDEVSEERTLFLSGALGGLGLMLCDEQSREIMFKVTPISIDQISECLADEKESFVKCSLLRFLCEWIYECPLIVHNLLSSTASTNLAGMAATPGDCQSITHLLLGLAMEYLSKEEECGGWTRHGILQIIMKIGISKYTSSVEGLKTIPNEKMPWVVSEMEYKNWQKFCRRAVLTIRKRVVEELAAGSGDSDDESDERTTISGSDDHITPLSQGIKPLQRLVSQQAKEIEEMTMRLEVAEAKVASQDNQLSTWKRRMESTPTELDLLLNEFISKSSDSEEKVRLLGLEIERQKSAKDAEIKRTQEELLECEGKADRIRSQEQEIRDNLERTEEEMKALSQAYTSLEEEYQRQQNEDDTGAQSSVPSQQLEGEAFQEQNGIGSTEVTTLRSENTRLKNDARKADEWMSMAVKKMNEMGTANVELEKQVLVLHGRIEESRVADNTTLDNQRETQQRNVLEAEVESEKTLRLAAEERLPHFENLQIKYELEQHRSEHLQHRVTEIEQELSQYKNMESNLQTDVYRVKELEKCVFEAEEATRVTAKDLELETEIEAEGKVERELNNMTNTNHESWPSEVVDDNEKIEQLRADHDKIVGIKNAEIDALRLSLLKKEEKYDAEMSNADTKYIVSSIQTIDEIRQSSQEKIYRLESIIRELKDRLESDLGAYNIEDIFARDEEIEELRKANESAQEWMGKAVEHDNRNSNQIQKLTDENASLSVQLEMRKQQKSETTTNSSYTENEEIEKWQESDLIKRKFAALETELEALKQEKDANQGLLDELGIAMDDVAVMQQQLSEHKMIKSELENKLSGNVLSEENNELRSSNEDLQKRLNEFEDWAQVAQTKIGDILSSKDETKSKLQEVKEEVKSLRKENDALQSKNMELGGEKRVLEQLFEDIEKFKSENGFLRNEINEKERQHNNLLESLKNIEQEHSLIVTQRNGLEKDVAKERQLLSTQSTEIDDLKATNISLLDLLEQSKVRIDDDHVTAKLIEKNAVITMGGSIGAPEVQAKETRDLNDDDQFARIDDTVEELERTKVALAAAEEALSSNEDVTHKWEERVSQLEFELKNIHDQMQDQENDAANAIMQWQQNVIELEEKHFELEESLKKALESKYSFGTINDASDSEFSLLKEENVSLRNKINDLQTSLAGKADNEIDAEIRNGDTIVELEEALKNAQDALAKDEVVVQKWEDRTAELEMKIQSLETELRESEVEANEVISQWQDNCAAADLKYISSEEELNHLKAAKQTQDLSSGDKDIDEANYNRMMDTVAQKEEELRRLNEVAESSKHSMQKLRGDILALKREIESISEDLVNQEVEAKKSTEQLKERLGASEQENCQLKNDLEKAKSEITELQDLRSELSNCDQISLQWGERTKELSESIAVLKDQLNEQEHEALDAVEQWQSACSDLEMKCANLELVIKDSRETISTRGWSIEQLRSRNESYCAQIENLKATSQTVESSLRDNILGAKSEILRLVEMQEVERNNRAEDQLQGQAKLAAEKERNSEARIAIETLSSSLKDIQMDSEDTLNQWTVRCDELKTALADVQHQLEEQENEANEAISIWEIKTDELEKELDFAEDTILQLQEILTDKVPGTQVSLVVAAENLLNENANLTMQIENANKIGGESTTQTHRLESENKVLKDSLVTNEEKFQKLKIQNDQMTHQLSLKSEDKLEEERDRLIGVVAQLEEELREANSMLQACVTDESIDKASEFAANAIRNDIYNMRNQLNEYQQRFEDEKAAREVADLEIDRLRDDIGALLSLSDHEKSPTNLKKLTTKSIEKLQKLQHSEIDHLRKSLFRALEDLEFARSTERNTNETLSKLRLQISIYEQEIVAAKSEVNFLSEAMEELRQTEDSKRASLEYRIGSLENENDVVRKYQANELDSLRNELAQLMMEKDLILHQLKETEKTNASLVLATSTEENGNRQQKSDFYSECVKLRIENAHLLTISAEDKGKAERRLRELLSAQVASSELDVILEHELRLSAETALKTLKKETSELRNDNHFEKIEKKGNRSMEKDLNDLRNSLTNLKDENASLKVAMDDEASKAKQTIDLLTDECRKAQTKAFKFDRDARTELAVQSEVSKMRISNMALPGDKTFLYEDLVNSKKDDPYSKSCDTNLPSAEAFDLIRKQQKEIQEERIMYSETLQEHEDLLALVAQQDLEKSCLREALIEVAGNDVADDAMKRAEEFAVIRYGNVVHVSN